MRIILSPDQSTFLLLACVLVGAAIGWWLRGQIN